MTSKFVPFLVDAVEQLRDREIVHFDLKPGNILQCGGVWKVADFDMAEYVSDGYQLDVSPRGTHGFTDPDVLQQEDDQLVIATPRTDLFSIGAIL